VEGGGGGSVAVCAAGRCAVGPLSAALMAVMALVAVHPVAPCVQVRVPVLMLPVVAGRGGGRGGCETVDCCLLLSSSMFQQLDSK